MPACDPLDDRLCLLPYPSNHFTVADASSATGLRVAFPADGAPVNTEGVPVDLAEWNRNDGFSPNSTLLVSVPGLDPAASNLPPWTDLGASLADDASVVLVDVTTGERIPLWAELDTRALAADDHLLVIHPAIALTEGHTYAVAVRGVHDHTGAPITPSAAFAAIAAGATDGDEQLAARAASLQPAFDALARHDIDPASLYVAWDFTVASTASITGRMLHMRDATLAELGTAAPPYEIHTVTDVDTQDEDNQLPDGVVRRVIGTYTVRSWMTGDGEPGQRLDYGDTDLAAEPDARPQPGGTVTAPFQCNITAQVFDAGGGARIIQYGHGLLGSPREVNSDAQTKLGNAANAVVCATNWAGMSEDDIGNAAGALTELSQFPTLPDRLQQGVLNQLVFTRLLTAPDGLSADPAFAGAAGTPLYDPAAITYVGNSQGAIMGLMFAGVSTDIERFVLGVAGMNYSVLLPRSVDFDLYEAILTPSYPDAVERGFLIALLQMLWDRGEGAGYVNHVTADPLPGTEAKTVLIHVALGDWQVTELAAFIEARSLGIPIHRPVVDDGRSAEVEPGWGLASIEYPSTGSGLIYWDSGSDPIPFEATPPRSSRDSHEDPRRDPQSLVQIATFLYEGQLIDVCDGAACHSAQRQ